MSGLERQTAIYLGGVSGLRPRVPLDVGELEARAKRAMSAEAFAYVKAAVVEAVGGRVPVLLGRPYVYGLAIAGERGVRKVIQNHLADAA